MNQMGTLVSDGRSFSNSWDGRSISSSCGSSKSTSSSGSKVRPIKATQSFGMPSPTATRSSKSKKLHTLDRSHSSKDGRSKDLHGFRRSVSLNMATSASYLIGEWPKADSLIAQAYFCPSNLTLNKTTQTPNEWCQSESLELCPNKSDSEQPSSVAGENLKFNNIKARLSRRESRDMTHAGSPGHISLINNRQLMLPNKPAAVAYPSPSTTSKLWDETVENFDQLSCDNKSVVHRSTMTQTCQSSLLINDDQKKQTNNFFDSSKNKFSFPLTKLHFNRLPPDGSDHFYSMKEIGLGKEIGLESYDLLFFLHAPGYQNLEMKNIHLVQVARYQPTQAFKTVLTDMFTYLTQDRYATFLVNCLDTVEQYISFRQHSFLRLSLELLGTSNAV